ncbi:methylmalonyl Co-A mutase-associated GTPase MeaB [Lutibacter sp.]|uniref:methylmalonyl Co-A mutase-associated GTPase MeaB n=1 Tax=Lutibacter sp. TaxID=1925666 RepID=UPI0025C4A893|nr:methylmalonyl Co-A mutase-associated GTPase MeaB [Lutibacter sp.]MCF6169230.1 methylmalonyl Co-A mutase-associated GTPase MeaB [Lutibacter sp.]
MTKKKSLKSALYEVEGIKQPATTNDRSIKKVKLQRRKQPSEKEFVEKIIEGDISYLSRAITLIESTNPNHQKKANTILERCLPFANKSIRIGITGVPGVGKSTFIEAFGKLFTNKGKKVAVLAIDPSSSINKGSILGDKTRMEELVKDQNAYIRPSPSGSSLGGVAQKTRETIILCEAAGYDVIFIETVGVGQSETAVHSMVDFFLLLKLAGAGDELQGIKRGIIEMADAIVINKADKDNIKRAELAKNEFTRALHLYPPKESNWQPQVTTCSAFYNEGIDTVYKIIDDYFKLTKANGFFDERRNEQNNYWLLETINQQLTTNFYNKTTVKKALKKYKEDIKNLKTTPFKAAQEILKLSKK